MEWAYPDLQIYIYETQLQISVYFQEHKLHLIKFQISHRGLALTQYLNFRQENVLEEFIGVFMIYLNKNLTLPAETLH